MSVPDGRSLRFLRFLKSVTSRPVLQASSSELTLPENLSRPPWGPELEYWMVISDSHRRSSGAAAGGGTGDGEPLVDRETLPDGEALVLGDDEGFAVDDGEDEPPGSVIVGRIEGRPPPLDGLLDGFTDPEIVGEGEPLGSAPPVH